MAKFEVVRVERGAIWGSGNKAPCPLNFGTSWSLTRSFTPQPIYADERAACTHRITVLWTPEAVRKLKSLFPASYRNTILDLSNLLPNRYPKLIRLPDISF